MCSEQTMADSIFYVFTFVVRNPATVTATIPSIFIELDELSTVNGSV